MTARTGWIAHYVFQGSDGEVRTLTSRVVAATRQEAMDIAAVGAPADDFVVQIHSESDEQFLGQVRSSISLSLDPTPFDPKDYEESK